MKLGNVWSAVHGIFEGGRSGGESIFEARERGDKQTLKVKIQDGNLVLRPFLAFAYII